MPKARQTCTRCSMRRQKCDKQLPCTRCIKSNVASSCSFTWKEGYDPRIHRAYPKSKSQDRDASVPSSLNHNDAKTFPGPSMPGSHAINPENHAAIPEQAQSVVSDEPTPASLSLTDEATSSAARNIFFDLDHASPNNLPYASSATGASLLPPPHDILRLIDYHESCLLWFHGCIHGRSFRASVEKILHSRDGFRSEDIDHRWLAVFFAVITASMSCASDSAARNWGLSKSRRLQISQTWFDQSISFLHSGDFMSKPHLYSCQAIQILSITAHLLGFSSKIYMLSGAAIKIAQHIGMHRLAFDADVDGQQARSSKASQAQKDLVVEIETKRRVWAHICAQDWLGIPSSEMYLINRLHVTSLRPNNRTGDEPNSVLGNSTSTMDSPNLMYDVGSLLADFHDATLTASDPQQAYEQVLKYDTKLRALSTQIRAFTFMDESTPSWDVNVSKWLKTAVTSAFTHKIIMLHRSFLGKSFTDPKFTYTRWASITASKSILKEYEELSIDKDRPIFCSEQAHVVGAGITLCLDLTHRTSAEPEFLEHLKLLEQSITLLNQHDDSTLACRGAKLLTGLLREAAVKAIPSVGPQHNKEQEPSTPTTWPLESGANMNHVRPAAQPNPENNGIAVLPATHEPTLEDPYLLPDPDGPWNLSWNDLFTDYFPVQSGFDNAFLLEDLLQEGGG